jgi:hypothetical protein
LPGDKNEQHATGNGIIQIAGDVHITVHAAAPTASKKMLSKEQRQRIALLVAEVESAEKQIVSQRRIRYALNKELNVASIEEVSDEMYRKASMYLSGWRACAAGEHQVEAAMVSQVLRIWTICPTMQLIIAKFTREQFGTTRMNDLTFWQMRCVLSFALHLWAVYWKGKAE